ncbi:MAG: TonB-dependent receptor plug domain-containing protein [Caldithrix sp.]|nr:TonB-dependent receptor plug domain-containing protein [Caldithrix sp.]
MKKITFLVLLFCFPVLLLAQHQNKISGKHQQRQNRAESGYGGIVGHVETAAGAERLGDVIIKIEGTETSLKSNPRGHYKFAGLAPDTYSLIFIKPGYYSLVMPEVQVYADKMTHLNVQMYPGDTNEFLFLEIGGIRVTADRALLSQEPETVHRITSGEIEHMQANSLGDVLQMIPGNEITSNFGLQRKQSVQLRTFDNARDDQAALFGTKIIVDDVPLSNNANLQSGVGVGYGSYVQTTSGRQYDLREVVAENLQRVEVVSGASSVEYGDHSQGLVKVKTRTSNVPTRFKVKNNPDSREANLMGSLRYGRTELVYNINYGYSERDIRISGDEYHRIAGSVKSLNTFRDGRIDFTQQFRYNRKIEEDSDDSDPYGTKAYNRDHHFVYAHQMDYNFNPVAHLYMRNYLDFRRRNSWYRRLQTPQVEVWTDRMQPGTREGIIVQDASYFSEVKTIGYEWSFGSKLKYQRNILWGDILNRFLIGGEFQGDDNTGPGKSFDLLKPPGGQLNTRPRSFNDTPGLFQLALFAENRMTGVWLLPYTIEYGFRLDSYNPQSFNPANLLDDKDIFDAQNGTFFNPRLGFKIKLTDHTQVRGTFSKASKTPALSYMYPEDFFLDVFDYTMRTTQAADGSDSTYRVPLVSTYQYNRSDFSLDGYQSTKYELALEQQIGDVGISLIGYHQNTDGIPRDENIPYSYNIYFWPDWPQSTNRIVEESVTTTDHKYSRYVNLGWTESSGLEVRLHTHRIKPLNMRFVINAAFKFKKYGSDNYNNYTNVRRFSEGDTLSGGWVVPEDMQVVPYYSPYQHWNQKTVVNYVVDYVHKSLGLWFTLRAQQVLWDRDLDIMEADRSAKGYFYNSRNYAISPATSTAMGLDRSLDPLDTSVDKSRPNDKWLFSIVVSKSLFKGADISLFVENILNDQAYYLDRRGFWRSRNPDIFWGIAFSSKLNELF